MRQRVARRRRPALRQRRRVTCGDDACGVRGEGCAAAKAAQQHNGSDDGSDGDDDGDGIGRRGDDTDGSDSGGGGIDLRASRARMEVSIKSAWAATTQKGDSLRT